MTYYTEHIRRRRLQSSAVSVELESVLYSPHAQAHSGAITGWILYTYVLSISRYIKRGEAEGWPQVDLDVKSAFRRQYYYMQPVRQSIYNSIHL